MFIPEIVLVTTDVRKVGGFACRRSSGLKYGALKDALSNTVLANTEEQCRHNPIAPSARHDVQAAGLLYRRILLSVSLCCAQPFNP